MEIRSIKHKGLKTFIEKGQEKALPAQYIDKLRDIIGYLLEIENIDEIFVLKKIQAAPDDRRQVRPIFAVGDAKLAHHIWP
jgi:hypothetical protein